MNLAKYFAALILAAVLITGCSSFSEASDITGSEEQIDITEVGIYYDIPYYEMSGVDPNLLSLDLYTINDTQDLPIMIYVHGGSWTGGDKANIAQKPQYFLNQGYMFVSVNYRLSTDTLKFPKHAYDLARAFSWVFNHSYEYGGDPSRIYIMGHSAGAHLVSIMATNGEYLRGVGLSTDILSGVISLDTRGYDIAWLASMIGGDPGDVYIYTFGNDTASWEYASPYHYVEPGVYIPPITAVFTGGDTPDYAIQRHISTERFIEQLANCSIAGDVVNATYTTHGGVNADFGTDGNIVTIDTMDFINNTPIISIIHRPVSGFNSPNQQIYSDINSTRNLTTAEVYYRKQGDIAWTIAPMTLASGDATSGNYSATLIGLDTNFNYEYYIRASDDYGMNRTLPIRTMSGSTVVTELTLANPILALLLPSIALIAVPVMRRRFR